MGRRLIKEINKDTPIVFCHGLLGWGEGELGGYPYFVCAKELKDELQDELPPFIFPSTGPISSLHDQACELFFQLKGGLTNYGREHSKDFSHRKHSRFYGDEKDFQPIKSTKYGGQPLYPEWNSENPLDFVGHSMGGPLLTTLQQMLADNYFHEECDFEENTDATWIHSISTVSGVHNGSQLTWILGADEETGLLADSAKLVRFICKILTKLGKFQKRRKRKDDFFYDLHLDQWNLRDTDEFSNVIKNLKTTKMPFCDDEDWAVFDLTPNAMEKHNKVIKEYPSTWYFSYLSKATFSLLGFIEFFIPFICHIFLWPTALLIGNYKGKTDKWKTLLKKWKRNDGMCPINGQAYPFLGREPVSKKILKIKELNKTESFEIGTWNIIKSPNLRDHAEVAMLPHYFLKKKGKEFYKNVIKTIIQTRTQEDGEKL